MKQYKIYGTPQGKLEPVKLGWSWPAFFFVGIWAMVKKMWALGISIVVVFFVLGFISGAIGGQGGQALDTLTGIANLVVGIIFGKKGNQWREKNLAARGYRFLDTVTASNPEGALAVFIKEHPAQLAP